MRALLAVPALPAAVWFVRQASETPGVVMLAALVPALAWTALAAWIGRLRPPLVVALFGWGAVVAAWAARMVIDLGLVTPVVGGPIVEEMVKGIGLLAIAGPGGDLRRGIACGAIVGIGFAMTENFGYLLLAAVQAGQVGLLRGVYLRGLIGGWSHALFTATTGAGLAGSGERGIVLACFALAAAVLQHVVWNALAAATLTDVVCNPIEASGACQASPSAFGLFVTAPAIAAVVLGPGVLCLSLLVRRSRS